MFILKITEPSVVKGSKSDFIKNISPKFITEISDRLNKSCIWMGGLKSRLSFLWKSQMDFLAISPLTSV